MTTIDNLKKEAKRWLKALRSDDEEARVRFHRAYSKGPNAPETPGLRDVQHALALERGAESWKALRDSLSVNQPKDHAELVERFLEFACWDHHTHGKGDHRMYDRAAQRVLEQHPEIARDSIYTAVVSGDIDEVRRLISQNPTAATEPGGPKGWPPILYLCFTRFTHQPTIQNAVEIARLLLDHGADPNSFYKAGDSDYSALVGAAGGGEQDSPRQPQSEALYKLLLDRGAGPYDLQVLYNTHFSGDILWWLKLTYERSIKLGLKSDWDDPTWSMIDMGGYGPSAFFILRVAIKKKDLELAEWALAHGASPNSTADHPKFRPTRLYHEAQVERFPEMLELLERYGADTRPLELQGEEKFVEACFRLDRNEVESEIASHPEYLKSTQAMFAAAIKDRADVVSLLLDLGFPLEIENEHKQRTLHQAAANNSLKVVQLLIDRGAEIDPRETQWGATPIGWASHGDHTEMIELLSKYSRNVWTLAYRGYVERLREILRVEPDLAKSVTDTGITPLWWIPDDEEKALEVVDLLLTTGADPNVKNQSGNTAADWARKLGMRKLVAKLTAAMDDEAASDRAKSTPTSERFAALAKDLLKAYESGYQPALDRLNKHYATSLTWEELRQQVRERLKLIPKSELPMSEMYEGYFALPHAQLLVARSAGFNDWFELERAQLDDPISPLEVRPIPQPSEEDLSTPMIQPVEMRARFQVRLFDGSLTNTVDVWGMLEASRQGDLETIKLLIARSPSLARCTYNYMPPIHLAIREGHIEVVRYLAELSAVNPKYRTDPYVEPLVTVALDRGFEEIAAIIQEKIETTDPDRPEEENSIIEFDKDEDRIRFEKLVSVDATVEVEQILKRRPELAQDPFAFWSEGVLSVPANHGHREMIETLLRYGAQIPRVTKWGARYYFKHYEIGEFLLDNGMDANHMNCHHTTLLHEMGFTGDVRKARLLIEHGADINAIDEEFRSTPLGFAARWGNREVLELLLDSGAELTLAGAEWATPLAWAQKKGHSEIIAILKAAGAR